MVGWGKPTIFTGSRKGWHIHYYYFLFILYFYYLLCLLLISFFLRLAKSKDVSFPIFLREKKKRKKSLVPPSSFLTINPSESWELFIDLNFPEKWTTPLPPPPPLNPKFFFQKLQTSPQTLRYYKLTPQLFKITGWPKLFGHLKFCIVSLHDSCPSFLYHFFSFSPFCFLFLFCL